MSMFIRALIAFLALPGMVAGLIPLLIIGRDAHPLIPYRENNPFFVRSLKAHTYIDVLAGILNGVVEDVDDGSVQVLRVA